MTFKEKIALDKERTQAAAKLREAQSIARTAIGQMKADADIFKIMAECRWMENLDPQSTGPKMVCETSVQHLTKLAVELTDRLEK